MSERGKRVFRFLLDPERDTDVIGRIEAQPSMTGYVRELVRRDIHEREMHDERLDFAALKASELQAENDKLRELVRDAWGNGHPDRSCGDCDIRDECHDDIERLRKDGVLRFSRCLFELRIEDRMRELGIEVE